MRNIKRYTMIIAGISIIVTGSNAFASGSLGDNVNLSNVGVKETASYIQKLGGTWANPDGCDSSDKAFFAAKELLASAMTAKAGGLKVSVWGDSCLTWGSITYPLVVTITLK